MTRYTVVWDPDVEVPFVNAWIAGSTRTRSILSEVANWLDTNLAHDPDNKGEPRSEHPARQIAVPISSSSAHISATFRVLSDDRQVRVICLVFRGA
jgi:hypothetical protein